MDLEKRLLKKLHNYPKDHAKLVANSRGDAYVREKLRYLTQDYDFVELRFREMAQIFGSQCSDFSPELSGFKLCIYFLLVEWMRPFLIVSILVFVDGQLIKIIAVTLVQGAYYFVQVKVIGVLDRSTALLSVTDFVFFMLIAYMQVLFLSKMQAVEKNVVGWVLVTLLCTKILFSTGGRSIKYLRELYNRVRIV